MKATAVLVALDRSERVITVPEPPPVEWYVPVRQPWSVTFSDEPPQFTRPQHRVFRLSTSLRSQSHLWMRVYNEGRSQTPESGYVYVEVA